MIQGIRRFHSDVIDILGSSFGSRSDSRIHLSHGSGIGVGDTIGHMDDAAGCAAAGPNGNDAVLIG